MTSPAVASRRRAVAITVGASVLAFATGAGLHAAGTPDPTLSALQVTPIATETPSPTTTSTPSPTTTAPAGPRQRMTVYGSAVKDSVGNSWEARSGFDTGTFSEGYWDPATDIKNTSDDILYRPEFHHFTKWDRPVANGTYEVTLKMREGWFTGPDQRVFDVAAEGQTKLTDVDIFKAAGRQTAYDRTFQVAVSDGQLNLAFTAKKDAPTISSIQLTPLSLSTTSPVPTTTTTPAPTTTTAPGYVPPATTPPSPSSTTGTSSGLNNSGTRPGLLAYGSSEYARPFAHQGSLVVAGRTNYGDSAMKSVSAAGGTVLVYLDAVIDNRYGRYHDMLMNASTCGGSVSRWPGNIRANSWGYLNDFRPGSPIHAKLECVLEKMVQENPHIGGFFADDLGSRSWFPGFSWSSFGSQNQLDYRNGAIALSKIFRKVADKYGLIVMVNGTWAGGSVAVAGGGYPDPSQHGNALADGMLAEHHTADAYWGTTYPSGAQWADQSATTKGMPFHFAVTYTDTQRDAFAKSGHYAFAATQDTYDSAASVWTSFRYTGLPSATTFPRTDCMAGGRVGWRPRRPGAMPSGPPAGS